MTTPRVKIVLEPLANGRVKAFIDKGDEFSTALSGGRETVIKVLSQSYPGVEIIEPQKSETLRKYFIGARNETEPGTVLVDFIHVASFEDACDQVRERCRELWGAGTFRITAVTEQPPKSPERIG